jgi:acetyl-CoA acetyltransferase
MARHALSGSAVIAGIGHTKFGSHPGRSPTSMIVEAAAKALQDAGIAKDMVDAVLVKPPTSDPAMMFQVGVSEALGLQPKLNPNWNQGGAANSAMIGYAVMAIEAGQCDIALICFADNPKTGSRAAYGGAKGNDAVFGLFGTLGHYGMIARRHIEQHGTQYDHLGAVAVACRRHGAANPNAQLQKPLTLDEYRASKPLVAPFRREDACLVSDGGAALVVMSAKGAKELGVRAPVPILGFGQGQTAWETHLRADLTTTQATVSAKTAFAMADLSPKDIDMAQLYDCFTIVPIMTLEDYGFCKKGEGGPFVAGGRLEIDGDLPMNTAGGLLSETGMPGMQLIIEGVRQMRGEANLQAKRARNCIISGQGGVMQTHATLILGERL